MKLKSLSDRNYRHITAGLPLLSFGRAAVRLFDSLKLPEDDAYWAAVGILNFGERLSGIFKSKSRFSAVLSLIKCRQESIRYKGMGHAMFFGDLVAVLLVSRRKRRELIRSCAETYPYLEDYWKTVG